MTIESNIKRKINVAILSKEPFFWGSRKYYHYLILNGYKWEIKNNQYIINATYIDDKNIIKGDLNVNNYDVLIVPGGGVGNNQALMKGFNFIRKVKIFKRNIANFIKQGGGYIGICGGAALMTNLLKDHNIKPETITEKLYDKSSLGISCVSSYFKNLAFPIFYLFQYKYPEKIGNSAYAFSSAPGETKDGKFIHSTGCTIDIILSKNNDIFQDFHQNTNKIRWWAGQALIVPEKTSRDVKILARYPKNAISDNKNMRINAWRYIGGIKGLIKAIVRALLFIKKNNLELKKIPIYSFYFAGDWELTDKIIDLNLSNLPCITSEIYPNKNKGRIILSTVHPEYMIWNGGYIEQKDSKKFNCIGNGLYKWKNIDGLSENPEEDLIYNWWILRRFVAWCAKIPRDNMPPMISRNDIKIGKTLLKKNIFWDGSLLNQMDNI